MDFGLNCDHQFVNWAVFVWMYTQLAFRVVDEPRLSLAFGGRIG